MVYPCEGQRLGSAGGVWCEVGSAAETLLVAALGVGSPCLLVEVSVGGMGGLFCLCGVS